ncbi:mannitol dehydrogenase family protein [Catenovulum agarivorans]|uniref:mannitol dehydrogenase family protein n=1 Tax=Catenovulum agarivorans TaxID=1172192 RepID=UPI0002F48EFB|nr:mannitol dehydrogenase family protein [Catenovulum agarivorans]
MQLSDEYLTQHATLVANLGIAIPNYDRRKLEVGIVHLGLGAFHRSHQAVFNEEVLNLTGDLRWGICAVAFSNEQLKNQINAQDGLYTNVRCGKEQNFQIVGCIKQALVASKQMQEILETLALPSVKLVSLTVTEKGYCLNEAGELDINSANVQHDIKHVLEPKTAIGILVAGFYVRFLKSQSAFNVIACDNLPHNGDKLKKATVALANEIRPELARWIEANAHFPNTMVDCITPKTEVTTVSAVETNCRFNDSVPVQREPFAQWVIEDIPGIERPQWEKAGVTFTSDVAGFEKAKLRILNGTHSALAYIGSLLSIDTVYNAINNTQIKAFISGLLEHEIIPSIDAPVGLDLADYAKAILERYDNPSIRHLLNQIAADGSIKIPVRTLEPIKENLATGRSIERLSIVVAAWIRFIVSSVEQQTEISDPKKQQMQVVVRGFSGDSKQDVAAFLSIEGIVEKDLLANPKFVDSVVQAYSEIDSFLASLANTQL